MKEFGPVACMGKKINAYGVLVGQPEGKRSTWNTYVSMGG